MTSENFPHNTWSERGHSQESKISDTFYNLNPLTSCNSRKTRPEDLTQICGFATEETVKLFPSSDPGRLYERSVFSLVVMDYTNTKVLGHASFSDTSQDSVINIDGKLWKTHDVLCLLTPLNTLFVSYCVHCPSCNPEEILPQILESTFHSCMFIEYIALQVPLDYEGKISLKLPICHEVELTVKDKTKRKLIFYNKNHMYPPLFVREGREHDLDDLSPLIKIDSETLEQYFNKSYLNELIAMSERNNRSIVAERKSVAVGMITVTTDIDYKVLNDFYQLEPFHGLYKPHVTDEINMAYLEKEKTHRVCVEDNSKYIKDEFDENCTDSGGTSAYADSSLGSAASSVSYTDSSASYSSFGESESVPRIRPDRTKTAARKDKDVLQMGIGTAAGLDEWNAGKQEGDSIIPMVGNGNEVDRRNMDAKSDPEGRKRSHGILGFPAEVIRIYEQARTGHYNVQDIKDIPNELRSQLIELEEHLTKKEYRKSLPDTQLNASDSICYPIKFFKYSKPVYHGIPNAIAINLCVMENKFRMRMLDLIRGAFLSYPNQEYCIVTIPCGQPVPHWLEAFVKVAPRKQSLFGKELYILHRNVLDCRLKVRMAQEEDVHKIAKLLDTLVAKNKILTDFCRAVACPRGSNGAGLHAFVVVAGPSLQSHIIGLVIVSDVTYPEHYKINYDTDSFVYTELHSESEYAYVHHFILIPTFRKYAKMILKEVMRFLCKNVLFHSMYSPYQESRIMNHQSLLNNLDDWILVSPRSRINYGKLGLTHEYDKSRVPPPEALDSSEPHALLLHSKKFTYDTKVDVTARIVFVGASETALYCLEKMLATPHLNFLHLTIISPHGIPGSIKPDYIRSLFFPRRGGPALSMECDHEWYDRVGIHVKVNVVFGKVTALLREEKVVLVNNEDIVPYDTLILAVGQQFVRPDCGEVEIDDVHMKNVVIRSLYSQQDRKETAKKTLRRNTKKPHNVFAINTEIDAADALHYIRAHISMFPKHRLIIHGACLQAYCSLHAMLKMGVSPERILFVIEPGDHMEWEERQAYRDSVTLKEAMLKVMEELKIEVLPNHTFSDWSLDVRKNLVTQVQFNGNLPHSSDTPIYPCFAYFGFSHYRVSDEFISAVMESYVIVDGGVSIDLDFKTSDPSIFAAGSCSAYKANLLAGKYNHVYFNSAEVGYELAESILAEHDYNVIKTPTSMKSGTQRPIIPCPMKQPVAYYAELPGGWYYFSCRKPGVVKPKGKDGEDEEELMEITTGSIDADVDPLQRYFCIKFGNMNYVEAIECLSKDRFSPWNLLCLYGSHESMLNNLWDRYQGGEVRCLYKFFQQPWTSAICIDRWSNFKAELMTLISTYLVDEDITMMELLRAYVTNIGNKETFTVDGNILRRVLDSSGLKKEIEMKFLEFLQYHKHELPMYARADLAELMIQERALSPLMHPASKFIGKKTKTYDF